MTIPVIVCSGLTGNECPAGHIQLRPYEVGDASQKFASTYILRMGLHYDHYVLSGYLPAFQAVQQIYTTAVLAATTTTKIRATSVTGNIGESIATLVARRKLRSTRINDIQPILVDNSAKAPDYRMRFRPMFPQWFQTATQINPQIQFAYWPVESKAAATADLGLTYVKRALSQLGTFWYERFPHEPEVAGFGVAMCFIYRGTTLAPQRLIRIHVFTPSNQVSLRAAIKKYRKQDDRPSYLQSLETANSPLRGFLNDVD
jgi:hypothetical protein